MEHGRHLLTQDIVGKVKKKRIIWNPNIKSNQKIKHLTEIVALKLELICSYSQNFWKAYYALGIFLDI
jgi:hypothetical protein